MSQTLSTCKHGRTAVDGVCHACRSERYAPPVKAAIREAFAAYKVWQPDGDAHTFVDFVRDEVTP